MSSWQGKAAVVTGGASGIGRAAAVLLAQGGAKVVVADLNESGGRETVHEAGGPGNALFVKADTTSEADLLRVVDTAVATFGGVHLLHNNAAIMVRHERIEDVPAESFRRVIDVNLTALFLAARAVAPVMRRQGGGAIVNMSSLGGIMPVTYALAYAAAKAGVLGLTRSLAAQLKPAGIRVNAILPSWVDTPLVWDSPGYKNTPPEQRQILKPGDIARAVLYAGEREDLTGAFLTVDYSPEGPRLSRLKEHERIALGW